MLPDQEDRLRGFFYAIRIPPGTVGPRPPMHAAERIGTMKTQRCLFTVVLVLALTTTGVFAAGQGYGSGQGKQGFSDTKGHWGDAAITNLQGLGILNGYADGTFAPMRCLQRNNWQSFWRP